MKGYTMNGPYQFNSPGCAPLRPMIDSITVQSLVNGHEVCVNWHEGDIVGSIRDDTKDILTKERIWSVEGIGCEGLGQVKARFYANAQHIPYTLDPFDWTLQIVNIVTAEESTIELNKRSEGLRLVDFFKGNNSW